MTKKEERDKVYHLMYKTHLPLFAKKALLNDPEFMNDAIETVELYYAKYKNFSLKKAFKELVKEYRGQVILITAKSLNGSKYEN